MESATGIQAHGLKRICAKIRTCTITSSSGAGETPATTTTPTTTPVLTAGTVPGIPIPTTEGFSGNFDTENRQNIYLKLKQINYMFNEWIQNKTN